MDDDPIKKLQGLKHLYDSYAEARKLDESLASSTRDWRLWEEASATKKILDDLNRQEELMRLAVGPVEALRRANILDVDLARQNETGIARQHLADYEALFRRPEFDELARLAKEAQESPGMKFLRQSAKEALSVQRAMEAMCSPWLKSIDEMQSIASFAKLQNIGYALDAVPAFDAQITEALRSNLGDWRDTISWPEPIFVDAVVRSNFYVARGFDRALTDFPAPAFHEGLDLAQLRKRPTLVDRYGSPAPAAVGDTEDGDSTRMIDAYDWLRRCETHLRCLIDEAMTKAYGPDWARSRLPSGLLEEWHEKKRAAELRGENGRPLIAYADFTDYERVICKRDNWREVFASIFGRPESVRESLQRMYPIRICTMHARPITQDDELFLFVEIKRLMQVIMRR